jgi:hypothetical protein
MNSEQFLEWVRAAALTAIVALGIIVLFAAVIAALADMLGA